MIGLKTHRYYDPTYVMYVIVGHSAALRFDMSENLHTEIARGLWWFMLILLGGVAVCFIIFSYIFERRLQIRVTKPISELSKQIRNPKEFLASRPDYGGNYAHKTSIRSQGTSVNHNSR